MTYDERDAAWDEFYDQLSRELYDEHREQAIKEFTSERLKSFYVQHPDLMRPAVDAIQEGKWQQSNERHSAALVFYVSAIELLLKAALLKPVVYGLVHHEALAEVVIQETLNRPGYDVYKKLLSALFKTLVKIDLNSVMREGQSNTLLTECKDLQDARNKVIHQGASSHAAEAERSRLVAVAVFEMIVQRTLHSLGLTAIEKGRIVAISTFEGGSS